MLQQQITHQIVALKTLFQAMWTVCKFGQNAGHERPKGHETFKLATIWKLLICH